MLRYWLLMLCYLPLSMLNIVNILKKKQKIRTNDRIGQSISINKKNIAANKEWVNSVYNFNKNIIRFLPAVHNYIFKIIIGYFNLVSTEMKETLSYKKARKIYRFSTEKVWISTPEIKHLSEKLYITIYIYNRIYNVYKEKLDLLEFNWGPSIDSSSSKKIVFVSSKNKVYIDSSKKINLANSPKTEKSTSTKLLAFPNYMAINNKESISKNSLNYSTMSKSNTTEFLIKSVKDQQQFNVTKKIVLLRRFYPTFLGRNSIINKLNYINIIKWLKLDKLAIINQYKSNYLKFSGDKQQWITQLEFLNLERHNYLINQFEKELAYIKLKQEMLFNQFKFNELYLTPMIDTLHNVYNKKIIFNIVALKCYYLNSSILSQIIITKLKKERYRGKPLIVVNGATSGMRIPKLGSSKFPRQDKEYIGIQNVILDNFKAKNGKKDRLEEFLLSENAKSDQDTHKLVIKNLENKVIGGMFFKISGRLTKRFRAERARSRLRSKGTLKNVYSAHKGYSSNLSRGYCNINVEKTMIHSKTRIGAYGLTGWMASY